jgi:signal transduction histidine kinase
VGGTQVLGALRGRVITPKGIPMWVYCGAGAFAAAIVTVALAMGGSWLPVAVQVPLAVITLWPWIPGIRQKWISVAFVVMSIMPTALLACTGGSPLLFGLLALSASRVAVSTTLPKSLAYGLLAAGVVVARPLLGYATNWMVWKTYVELGLALGWAMRSQRMLVARSREASSEHARLAALEERRRIARDVHDVLAHTLTILMVHLNSARLQVREDPEGTAEIRKTVGLLSEPPAANVVVGPIETAHAIEDLVATYRKAGVNVELQLDVEMAHMGLLAEAPNEVWESGYRIVQESLANAVKHAPSAAVLVWIGVDDTGLHMKCSNPLAPGVVRLELPSGGNGLTGMCERVKSVGGVFSAGLDDEKVWVVQADLPLKNAGAESRSAQTLGRAS